MKVLFVCSRNKWRSRTAETIFKDNGHHEVRSAGTESTARIRITQAMINWADQIFVMESKHEKKLLQNYSCDRDQIEVLDIPDDYTYMDSELIDILRLKLSDLF